MESVSPYIGIFAAPLGMALVWIFVCLVTAALGGWRKLAGLFPAIEEPPGEVFSMQRGRFRIMNYNSVLRIVLSERGLYISVFFLFRPFHPPLMIPWETIKNVHFKTVIFFRYVSFDVCRPDRLLTVHLSRRVAESPRWKAEIPA